MKSDIEHDTKCPKCGSKDIQRMEIYDFGNQTVIKMQCRSCNKRFPMIYAEDAK